MTEHLKEATLVVAPVLLEIAAISFLVAVVALLAGVAGGSI